MKIALVMVMSVDGKTTRWGEPQIYQWTSKEDEKYFFSLIQKQRVIIMGRRTFEASKSKIKLSSKLLRVVMTKDPDKYKDLTVLGQLEFTSESVREIVKRLEDKGFKDALLVGGGEVNTSFFRENLIDELWLTVEPRIFGKGNNLVAEEKLDVNLRLKSIKKLNPRGTVLLKYRVLSSTHNI